jgi:hypothetical protein
MVDWDTIEGVDLCIELAKLLGYYVARVQSDGQEKFILAARNAVIYPPTPMSLREDEESAWADAPIFYGSQELARWLRDFVSRFDGHSGYSFRRETNQGGDSAYFYQPSSPFSHQEVYSAIAEGEGDGPMMLASCRLVGKLLNKGIIKDMPF